MRQTGRDAKASLILLGSIRELRVILCDLLTDFFLRDRPFLSVGSTRGPVDGLVCPRCIQCVVETLRG
jgi:hypothetical protein